MASGRAGVDHGLFVGRGFRSVCSYRTESREGWCDVFRQGFLLLNEADVDAVIVESES